MAGGRYSAEFLLYLRDSPLCVKPPNLPPPEEWMGPPPETIRNQQKASNDRAKSGDALLLNQESRRQPHDRNGSRNAANPDEIILGPPRTSFASATSMRNHRTADADKGFKDSDRQDRSDRFNFRNRAGDSDFGREPRDGRNAGFRRRGDQDQDSEGWSTVKPRKSFGHEGAERFHGRMGGVGATDRFGGARDDRRARDRDDREGSDRRNRNFDHRSRDLDGDEPDTPRRNGPSRGKSESWFRNDANSTGNDAAPMSQRERIDRAKNWRDRDPEDKPGDRYGDRSDRNYERRWDRDCQNRVENDPEWLDEPAEDKTEGHTEADFKKFMEEMKAARGGAASKSEEKSATVLDKPAATVPTATQAEQKVVSAPAVEQGPDKFFAAYASTGLDIITSGADAKDVTKLKAGKSSRFMAFLAPQEDSRAKTEPATPAAAAQPADKPAASSQQSEAEKEAFALLIQKLHMSGIGSAAQSSAPPAQTGTTRKFPESPFQELQQKSAVGSPESFQQYGSNDRRDDPRLRTSQPSIHDLLSPRAVGLPGPGPTPPPATRPEQALQDLLAQRHQLPGQANARAAQNMAAVNRNTEFLMNLMQGHRDAPPEQPRTEQLLTRMPQPTKQMSLANGPDREQDYSRERSASQRQQLRGPGGPPGFLEDSPFRPGDVDPRPPPQPTQILQRPPPPAGLDHQMHPFLMGGMNPAGAGGPGASQMAPQRPMIPPPNLLNNGPRNMPMPGMYPPPSFPPPHGHAHSHAHGGPGGPGHFPPGPPPHPHGGGHGPGDGLVGPPMPPPGVPRSMQPPPGFFGGPPPPGFMPPPNMGGGAGGGAGGGGGFPVGPDGPQPPNAGPGPLPVPGPGPFGGGGLPGPFDRLDRMAGMDRRGMMPPGAYRGP
ncbi:741d5b51-ff40-478f-8f79-378ab706426d [Thermothielavioides terrestris]|uniref:741d5b51-ff40-478f-8f79-378ab706426d n=1 Tax=Thermothielavioides terrestris TaxID=2587410 RepID=A0A3S4AKK0_9PEZI|nr:741d5b51-ff40-478f-8f79-378ab706426d [Thermothielavioides terrestris]